ncbi:MAG: CocE/NonD family hydrolase [Pacificimonas sp.]|jgi:putative CocE/NonD family hydrolase|nr:CocE/NonD family hydrolase [Pacificimonas sp.]
MRLLALGSALALAGCVSSTDAPQEPATAQTAPDRTADQGAAAPAADEPVALRVPLRDGVELAADLWLPADQPGPFPSILVRTPYGKSHGFLARSELGKYYSERGYAVVLQDVRGKGESGGTFNDFSQEGADGFDTIEWIADQPWSNARVCMMGLSYLGTVQWLAAAEGSEYLKCIVPSAAPGHPFVEAPYRGGAFVGGLLTWAYGNEGDGPPEDAEAPDWDTILKTQPLTSQVAMTGRDLPRFQRWIENNTFNEYWKAQTVHGADFERIAIPALHVTGWFDDSLVGTMYYWDGMKRSPAANQQYLMIGPWTHMGTFMGGELTAHGLSFGENSLLDMREVTLPFFERYLKQDATVPAPPQARLYITGQNEWAEFGSYPSAQTETRKLYLHHTSGGNDTMRNRLSWTNQGTPSDVEFVYDPRDPAPAFHTDVAAFTGEDADPLALHRRSDVVRFTSAPLQDAITIAGPLTVRLYAATEGRDTDFVVRLIDVAPDGTETKPYINDGVIRARYRNSFEETKLVTPGEVVGYDIDLFDIAHQFAPGHRLRLEITSSLFPAIYPNSNTGNPIATDTQALAVTQTIMVGGEHPSHIELEVLPD